MSGQQGQRASGLGGTRSTAGGEGTCPTPAAGSSVSCAPRGLCCGFVLSWVALRTPDVSDSSRIAKLSAWGEVLASAAGPAALAVFYVTQLFF